MAHGGGFVVVKVAKAVDYSLHRALLVEHSEYFKKALNEPWKEAQDGVVRLEDVESSVCRYRLGDRCMSLLTIAVDVFVDWLYAQMIPKRELLRDTDGRIDGSAHDAFD